MADDRLGMASDDDSECELIFSEISEEDGDGGDYDDMGTGSVFAAEPDDADEQKVDIVTLPELKERYKGDIENIMKMMDLTEGEAWRAMRHYDWQFVIVCTQPYDQCFRKKEQDLVAVGRDVHKVTSSWFEDNDKAKSSLGICAKSHLSLPDPESKITCPVCYCDVGMSDTLNAGCGHSVCKSCWSGYLKAYVSNSSAVTRLKCPDADCRVTTPRAVLYAVASKEDQQILDAYEDRLLVDSNRRASWCSKADCIFVSVYTGPPPKLPTPLDVYCECGQTYCFTCKEEAHRPVDCFTVKQWNLKNTAESENITWILANTKACPNCQTNIQKNQGCMHMTCTQCRHEFCWLCRGAWSSHGTATGGYYACNKYEEDKAKGTLTEEENRRKEARVALERYTHYYQRYHSHDNARKKAQDVLTNKLADTLRKLNEVTKTAEGQLGFLVQAYEQVVDCRRTLKWTYAYGFYKFDTLYLPDAATDNVTEEEVVEAAKAKEAIEARKAFFEFLQQKAESSLEHLSKAVEEDIKRYCTLDAFWTAANKDSATSRRLEGMDDHEFIAAEFLRLQVEIVNLTQISKRFFAELVLQLELGLEGMADRFGGAGPST